MASRLRPSPTRVKATSCACGPASDRRRLVAERSGALGFAVHGDDGRAAESEVVLQGDLGLLHLALLRLAPELPVELGALREPGGAERVALGDETARRVHDPLATVGDGTRVDQLAALACLAEPEALVGDQL